MPSLAIPPSLKSIKPHIRRAEELDGDNSNPKHRLISYYCRQYAVEKGLPAATDKESKGTLIKIMDALESEREIIGKSFSAAESFAIVKEFGDNIFERADAEDKRGEGGKGTAQMFSASSNFYEVLELEQVRVRQTKTLHTHRRYLIYLWEYRRLH